MTTPLFQEIMQTEFLSAAEDDDGARRGAISSEQAAALHNVVAQRQPSLAVELGMANGLSTMAILTAMRASGAGRLISIDPHQSTEWGGDGSARVARYQLAAAHTLVEDYDYLALPRLLEAGTVVDLAYVDGWHTFDHVLLDIFYIDRMLRVGGVIGFNDCGFPAVHKALKFLLSHRSYEEIDVGLKPDYAAANRQRRAIRRIVRWSRNDRYFQKLSEWRPPWNFYKVF